MQSLKYNILLYSEYIIKFFVCRYMSFVTYSLYCIYYFKMIGLMLFVSKKLWVEGYILFYILNDK